MPAETSGTDLSEPSGLAPRVSGVRKRDDIALLDLIINVAERKRMVAWITAVFAIVAAIAVLILPQTYTAAVTLLPPQQSSSMSSVFASQLSGLGGAAALAGSGFGFRNPNEMYIAMLRSRIVEDAMVQHFELMKEYHKRYVSDARRAFEKHTDVTGGGKDGLIHISVRDHDPNRASELANGYVEQFRSLSQNIAVTEASQRRLFFEQELLQAKNNLATAEEALKQTEQTTGVIQLDGQARALIESGAALRAEVAAREVQIQGIQTYATSENSQLIQAQRELGSLRAQVAKLNGSEDGTGDGFIVPKGRVPEAGLEYIRKLRDVKYYETIFDVLARQFELAKLDEAKEGALIQVMDPATPPDKRSFPKRTLTILGATLLGLIVGVFTSLILAGFEQMKRNPEDALRLALLRRAFWLRPRPNCTAPVLSSD